MFSLAVYGPLLGGLVATYMTHGRSGVQNLLGRVVRWRVAGKWYGTAVLLILIITLPPLLGGTVTGMVVLKPGSTPILMPFLILLIFQIFSSGLGEESGWRGYLLPTLQASYSQTKAIWIMGIIGVER